MTQRSDSPVPGGGQAIRAVGGSPPTTAVSPDLLHSIVAAVESLSYGSVEIVVHDRRVVQIERREKYRFPPTTGT